MCGGKSLPNKILETRFPDIEHEHPSQGLSSQPSCCCCCFYNERVGCRTLLFGALVILSSLSPTSPPSLNNWYLFPLSPCSGGLRVLACRWLLLSLDDNGDGCTREMPPSWTFVSSGSNPHKMRHEDLWLYEQHCSVSQNPAVVLQMLSPRF